MFKRILKSISQHKIRTFFIILLLVAVGYYVRGKIFPTAAVTRYITATAQKGTLIVSVDGTGQVSASNQIDVKPKASGDVVYLGVTDGQQVKAGALLVQLDTTAAEKTIRDLKLNLQSSQLTLEKLQGPAGSPIPKNKQDAQNNLQEAYDTGFNSVSSAFVDLPNIITGLNTAFFGSDKNLSSNQQNIDYYTTAVKPYDQTVLDLRDDVNNKYQFARQEYNQAFSDYKAVTRNSDTATIERMINETYNTSKAISDSIKSGYNLIQFYKDQLTQRNLTPNAFSDTQLSTLNTYTSQINSHLNDLLSMENTIKTDKDAVANADLDIQSQQLSLEQTKNSLADSQQNLENYYVRAPFDGVVAAVNVKKGDPASSGTSVVTFVTKQKIAEISLNEVDVSNVQIGQKATLTFDALPDLTITGQVTEIDTIGTVSQGVVSYNVKIAFDTQDNRVKPGMSVSAAVITNIKQDVLEIPNAAVKYDTGGNSYVQLLVNNVPQNQTVQAGLSNDTVTEITNGLKEGDNVITQTVTSTSGSSSSNNSSSQTGSSRTTNTFRFPGLGGGARGD